MLCQEGNMQWPIGSRWYARWRQVKGWGWLDLQDDASATASPIAKASGVVG